MARTLAHRTLSLTLSLALAGGCAPTEDDGADTRVDALSDATLTTIRVEATLSHASCTDTDNGSCGTLFRPFSQSSSVVFAGGDMRRVLPGARVRLGPFHLVKTERNYDNPAGTPATFTIRVMARSPALYDTAPDGSARFLGAQASLREIGRSQVVLVGRATTDAYVTVTLPSVFTALSVTASVGTASASWPSGCGSLPATSTSAVSLLEAYDQSCIQAVVTPTGVLQPAWLPVAILYEPPGNCSWTNLTQRNIAGSVHGITQESDVQTTTIHDEGMFWDRQHTQRWTRAVSTDHRALEARVGTAITAGTRLAASPNSSGNPLCSVPGANVPARPDGGPGRGDVYVMLHNPQLLAWSTGGASNVTMRPGTSYDLRTVTALQIATGAGLASDERFTDDDRRALLSLDPFVDAADPLVRDGAGRVTDVRVRSATTLAGDRFVPLGVTLGPAAGLSLDYLENHELTLTSGQSLSQATRSAVSSATGPDPVATVALSGVQLAATNLASAAASLVPLPGFAALAGQVVGSVFPLYTNSTQVTTVTTLTSTTLNQQLSGTDVAQQFHLQDTRAGLSVSLYYDRLFGTYVFLPPPPPFQILPRPIGVITLP